jgi:hypothetical protein
LVGRQRVQPMVLSAFLPDRFFPRLIQLFCLFPSFFHFFWRQGDQIGHLFTFIRSFKITKLGPKVGGTFVQEKKLCINFD